ncbi:MAG: class I SAM-dependent methyltransferase [Eubacteriales bacterium]|nr:class I SAM-dependent methyltransferase [Eubacteriales bacterium]
MPYEPLEPMADFFARRVDGYDEHMLQTVVGCKQGYLELAKHLPEGVRTLLDLGVGTGLELEAVYRRFPQARVTGVDLCRPMLDACAAKYAPDRLTLICGDYTEQTWEPASFDAAISFETLHHLTEKEKRLLFGQIYRALKPGGRYVQGDYSAKDEQEEAAFQVEWSALQSTDDSCGRVHFDTPFTAEHECALLREAGFAKADAVWREGNTVLIVAEKTADASQPGMQATPGRM